MRVAIGNDHIGLSLKTAVLAELEKLGVGSSMPGWTCLNGSITGLCRKGWPARAVR